MSKRVIIITVVLVMSVAAGAAVPALGQPHAWRTARAEDQRRIVALEWAVQGQPWPACGER